MNLMTKIKKLDKRQRQTIFFLFLTIIGVILISVAFNLTKETPGFLTYTNSRAKFSINYPDDWAVVGAHPDVPQLVVWFRPPKQHVAEIVQEGVMIIMQDLSAKPVSLAEYSKIAIDQMVGIFEDNIKVLESGPAMLGTMKAYKFVWIAQDPTGTAPRPLKMMNIWCVKGKTAYQFNYTAPVDRYDLHLMSVNEMAQSFRLKLF